MSKLQILFLIIALSYLIIKGIFFYLFYLQTKKVEKEALTKKNSKHNDASSSDLTKE